MSDNLLILGAGVYRTQDIDFPLANTLLADVSRYLDVSALFSLPAK